MCAFKRLHFVTNQISTNRSGDSNIGAGAPGRDWLGFGVGAEFQPSRVAEWLALGTEDLARLADAAHSDAAVPVRKDLIELAAMCNLVAEIFDGDIEKAKAWFKAVNPLLGDVAPRDMIRLGRFERLRMFIGSSLQGQ